MHTLTKRTYRVLFGVVVLIILVANCTEQPKKPELEVAKTYLNLGDSAQYVGKSVCAQCHAGHAETFSHTGMGQSFDTVSKAKSKLAGHVVLFDEFSGFSYFPFWKGDSLLIKEFRLENSDTVYKRIQSINYIIGSGQHTNSHIFAENGYLYQAPFTVYTQSGKLDFPPGFEHGNNSRFSRPIGLECMSCHNAMPTKFVAGSENKFNIVERGIDCERCHGPGSLHVEKIGRGDITDTATEVDWSIVNPKKLGAELQFQLCQRCHLQGNAVLAKNKSFLDFKPGMYLDSVMDVFLPRYQNSDDEFIMASHADRLKQSECFKLSNGSFNCISCHNPHVSVQNTNTEIFNTTCKSCHSNQETNFDCTRIVEDLDDNNCVKCHMPKSGSIDIPHVTVHDHFIRKPQLANIAAVEKGEFLGLKSINNPAPSPRSRAIAYLQQFERFEKNSIYLDSAEQILSTQNKMVFWQEWVHFYYLKNNPSGILKFLEENGKKSDWLTKLKRTSLSNTDAWVAYRIAESYRQFNDYETALLYAKVAVDLAPYHLEFKIKQSSIFAINKDFKNAEKGYLFVIKQNKLLPEAWSDLGYVQLAQNNFFDAENACKTALKLDPDYTKAKVNLASVYLAQENFVLARKWLEEILRTEPNNLRVKGTLDYLNENNL